MVEHRGIEPLTSGLQILAAVDVGMTGLRLTWEDATCVYLSKLALSGEYPATYPAGFSAFALASFFLGRFMRDSASSEASFKPVLQTV